MSNLQNCYFEYSFLLCHSDSFAFPSNTFSLLTDIYKQLTLRQHSNQGDNNSINMRLSFCMRPYLTYSGLDYL